MFSHRNTGRCDCSRVKNVTLAIATCIRHYLTMSPRRIAKFNQVVAELGGLVVASNPLSGWPGFLEILGTRRSYKVALHVSTVSPHARHDHEYRFQNPADAPAVSTLNGNGHPVLLGTHISDGSVVFVAIDGTTRIGREARFSILFDRRILEEARATGWSVYESRKGERVYAFPPNLFPAFMEQIRDGEFLPAQEIAQIAAASGAVDAGSPDAAARATRAVEVLVRRSGAGRAIRRAYGHACCMCQLASDLAVGAHIYPVEAPGSTDHVWNGLALCPNHHAAFDRHLIWVDPNSRQIRLHPSLHASSAWNRGAMHFVGSTGIQLTPPISAQNSPKPEMFLRRYQYFSGKYSWI